VALALALESRESYVERERESIRRKARRHIHVEPEYQSRSS